MKSRIELWRLFVSLTCFGVAFGLIRWTLWIVDHYGGGIFPILCVMATLLLLAAGTGVLFRRARIFMAQVAVWLVDFCFFWV
ncbi:MAG TPA: hypothetical protein VHV55_18405 [Pirellulales bacterium]|jgi:uncharacterized membrane protein|nr:hypothetical protein [Pirellulales bacterium]